MDGYSRDLVCRPIKDEKRNVVPKADKKKAPSGNGAFLITALYASCSFCKPSLHAHVHSAQSLMHNSQCTVHNDGGSSLMTWV